MKKRESGITLLTLAITIIVMLILAGIALRLSIGDNGIIGITGNTVDKYTNASDQEQEGLNSFANEFNEIINGGGTGDGVWLHISQQHRLWQNKDQSPHSSV